MARNERYVVDGHVVHNNNNNNNSADHNGDNKRQNYNSLWRYASWKRIVFVLIVFGVLIVTNPANDIPLNHITNLKQKHQQPQKRQSSPSSPSSPPKGQQQQRSATTFGASNQVMSSKRLTNYGLFALQEQRLQSVKIFALQQSWSCNYYDADIGILCESIGTNLAHGKPLVWDPSDRVHTAHRIICGLLILSALVSFCFPNAPPFLFSFHNNPYLDGFFSVFYRPNLLLDLFWANTTIYPALQKMNRIIPDMKKESLFFVEYKDLDFAFYVIVLVVLIGGGCNIVAAKISDKPAHGLSTVIAASLAYLHRTTSVGMVRKNFVLFFIFDQPVTAIGGYWTTLALSVLHNPNWFTFVLSWLLAGCFGSALGKYHLENIYLFGDFYKFFGMA